jgi:hypothetical protein
VKTHKCDFQGGRQGRGDQPQAGQPHSNERLNKQTVKSKAGLPISIKFYWFAVQSQQQKKDNYIS